MVKHILFDLDSTLYSSRYGLDAFFTQRLHEYTSSWLCLSPEEYNNTRKDGLKRHGTTIEWLIYEKGFTAIDDYYAYIHPENEADALLPDMELRRFLETLPCPPLNSD